MPLMTILFYFLVIVPSAIIHEYAHGFMADKLGDPTARYAGRLTLNPKAHIDPWGTILMPVLLSVLTAGKFLFAYAKPVPYNPYNLKNQRWGSALVAVAGPMSNFLLAFSFALVFRLLPINLEFKTTLINHFNNTNFTSLFSYASNFGFLGTFSLLSLIIIQLNILLLVFNLVPIPPLDGSKILYALLPSGSEKIIYFLEKNSFIILLVFVLFFFNLIFPIIQFLVRFLVGF